MFQRVRIQVVCSEAGVFAVALGQDDAGQQITGLDVWQSCGIGEFKTDLPPLYFCDSGKGEGCLSFINLLLRIDEPTRQALLFKSEAIVINGAALGILL